MKERPIIFSDSMVRAILEGRKTQTRRVVRRQPLRVCFPGVSSKHVPIWPMFFDEAKPFEDIHCPYGQPGDHLWSRETFFNHNNEGERKPELIEYRASPWDRTMDSDAGGWTPSIHMPRWASRLTLEVTKVRVERLQEISEEDCFAEGVQALTGQFAGCFVVLGTNAMSGTVANECYQRLWDAINLARGYGWDKNPWVWVVQFTRIEAPCAS